MEGAHRSCENASIWECDDCGYAMWQPHGHDPVCLAPGCVREFVTDTTGRPIAPPQPTVPVRPSGPHEGNCDARGKAE